MKKNRVLFVLLAGAVMMLSSCVKEQLGDGEIMSFGNDEVAFRIGAVQTKSTVLPMNDVLEIATVKKGDVGTFFLQDEVSSLDNPFSNPGTKGTPAYTENVNVLYPSFNVVALKGDVATPTTVFRESSLAGETFEYVPGSYVPASTDGDTVVPGSNSVYKHNYGEGIWGVNNEKLPTYFFMTMWKTKDANNNPINSGVSDLNYYLEDTTEGTKTIKRGSIGFKYSSPGAVDLESPSSTSGAVQQDILFTSHERTTAVNGETIEFYHALTGVKFANYFENKVVEGRGVKTIIREVSISGLVSNGHCIVTPPADPINSSTKSADVVSWDCLPGTATFTQSFEEATNPGPFVEYGTTYSLGGTNGKLNSEAAKKNLNDADGSLTFWFIPQVLNDNVKIKVTFDIWVNGHNTYTGEELEVSLGAALLDGHKEWKAGELHTFTLRPELVGVKISDTMENYVKKDLSIVNTGNVDQYVRVYIIGNWVGDRMINDTEYNGYDTVLMGYTDDVKNTDGSYRNFNEVSRWNDKDFVWEGGVKKYDKWTSPGGTEYDYNPYGEFVGLPEMGKQVNNVWQPGTPIQNASGENTWIRHDKFYYYMKPIGPGAVLPDTDPLFTSYKIYKAPVFYIADIHGVRRAARNVHFVMDVSAQAIAVPLKEDGTPMTYLEAWTQALNPTGASDFNINDL